MLTEVYQRVILYLQVYSWMRQCTGTLPSFLHRLTSLLTVVISSKFALTGEGYKLTTVTYRSLSLALYSNIRILQKYRSVNEISEG